MNAFASAALQRAAVIAPGLLCHGFGSEILKRCAFGVGPEFEKDSNNYSNDDFCSDHKMLSLTVVDRIHS
jgi:hypothetical protein